MDLENQFIALGIIYFPVIYFIPIQIDLVVTSEDRVVQTVIENSIK
jgi:hypothetical protein